MKKRLSKVLAALLLVSMLAGSLPNGTAFAAEATDPQTVGETAEQSGEDETEGAGAQADDVQDGTDAAAVTDEISEDTAQVQDNEESAPSGEQAQDVQSETEQQDAQAVQEDVQTGADEKPATFVDTVNYVYIESPYLETPGTQKIAFSLGGSLTGSETFALTVMDAAGNQEDWGLTEAENGIYVFEKSFADESVSGTYQVVSLNISNGTETQTITADDLGIEAYFGVNEKYDGFDELQPVSGDAVAEEAENADISIVRVDEEGNVENEDNFAEAIADASAETGVESGSNARAYAGGNTRAGAGSTGKVVVALDPGHDANDVGAAGNGLREEVLTLKIAQYCEAELESYGGVSVYMTRTGAACPYNCTSAGSCIAQRAQAAAAAGADIFVSIHLNSSTSSAASGAEVLVPNRNWKPEIGQQGEELADKILDELVAIGLDRRSIYSKDTTVDERYPDGSLSDYFSVMIYNKENNIPGIIVEHAFISNSSDANNYLKSDAGLQKLGVADATGIAKYFGLSKGSWVWDDAASTWKWGGADGSFKTNYWVYTGTGDSSGRGYWYYLDEDGLMSTGWIIVGGHRYYMYENDTIVDGVRIPKGAMQLGWVWDDETSGWYYFDENEGILTGWHWITDAWYYLDSDGKMYKGWLDEGGNRYYLNSSGHMLTGEQTIDGKTYFFNSSGALITTGWISQGGKNYYIIDNVKQTGWIDVGGKRYYLDPNTGERKSGWIWDNDSVAWYYLNAGGVMQTGWVWSVDAWYYLDSDGKMHKGWLDEGGNRYYLNNSGQMLKGEQTIDGQTYTFNSSGVLVSNSSSNRNGWAFENGHWYYYQNGARQTGWRWVGSAWYYMDGSGVMLTGWHWISDGWYYLNSSGAMLTGWHWIDNAWYYMNSSGKMLTGWQRLDGAWYYMNSSGAMLTGWHWIGNAWYYMNSSGVMLTGWHWITDAWYYLDGSGAMRTGWLEQGGATYYLNSSGKMLTGQQTINGEVYVFNSSGVLQNQEGKTGWSFENNHWYYYKNGSRATGWQWVDTAWYYIDGSGVMQTGWLKQGDTWYYLNSSGAMQKGWQQIGNTRYYLNDSGVMLTGWQWIGTEWYYFNGSGAMQTGWLTQGGSRYYLQSDGVMTRGWYYISGEWMYFNSSGVLIEGQALPTDLYTISGTSNVTVKQMAERFEKSGFTYPAEELEKGGASTIEEFCGIIVDEAAKENIKPEVVFAQAMLETGWLQFGGDVKIEQFNFAGLGATGGGVHGNSFKDIATGIRAQVQHLKAYCSRDALKQDCVDERFQFVNRYSAPFVEWLGQKENPAGLGWATGAGYGSRILAIIDSL